MQKNMGEGFFDGTILLIPTEDEKLDRFKHKHVVHMMCTYTKRNEGGCFYLEQQIMVDLFCIPCRRLSIIVAAKLFQKIVMNLMNKLTS